MSIQNDMHQSEAKQLQTAIECALLAAAQQGQIQHLIACLKSGANINAQDAEGNTPLHNAAHNGHMEIARYLIEAGAAVNVKNEANQTPLHLAIDTNAEYLENISTLIQAGARVNAKDKEGNTPLQLRKNIENTLDARNPDLVSLLTHLER